MAKITIVMVKYVGSKINAGTGKKHEFKPNTDPLQYSYIANI